MERIYNMKKAEISPLIKELAFQETNFSILENISDIKFENFKLLDFEDWEKGCIFSNEKEFKCSSRIEVDTRDTPGVYQTLNQLNPGIGALGRVCILPP